MEKGKLYLKENLSAGVVVFLVALPLCLGIALASGAPFFSGMIAGIVGGIVIGALSNSALSVSGPAAGLAALVLASISSLGSFETFLLAVVIAGTIQAILGIIKAGSISNYFPNGVIKGMLTAIGIIIILKQIPHALGYDEDYEGDLSFIQLNGENSFTSIINSIEHVHLGAIIITIVSLLILVFWDKPAIKKRVGFIPAGLVAVIVSVVLNQIFIAGNLSLAVLGNHLVNIPVPNSFSDFIGFFTTPDFTQITNKDVWITGITIAIIASLETLLSIEAIDKLDPQKRITNTNRELKAQGIGNIVSGLIGGLPITSVIVRSSANVNSGGKTKVSTIFHGLLLLLSVIAIPSVINKIPLAALASILLITGYKLAKISIFKEMYANGKYQWWPFIITVVATVFTQDLLQGVGIGIVVSVLAILKGNMKHAYYFHNEKHQMGDIIKIKLAEEVSFLNKASIKQTLAHLPENSKVIIDASASTYIDFDVLELIKEFRDYQAKNKNIAVALVNFKEVYNIEEDGAVSIESENLLNDFKLRYMKTITQNADLQKKITPRNALEILQKGNVRFVNNLKANRDLLEQVNATQDGQWPFAIILSCIDSRTSAELIFDQGLGDVFSVRIAGNIVNTDILGSMEFACKVAGSKLIVVLGHTKCGAVKGACDNVEMGNLTELLSKLQPAVYAEKTTTTQRDSSNVTFVENVSKLNVKRNVKNIIERSFILEKMVENGEIGVVGAMYDIETGTVEFYDDVKYIRDEQNPDFSVADLRL
ncbi:MAG: bifunctional SulP family inorganic anion transporter/carbonic anhydrase [Sphingobacteriales bacterium]|nr:MAG: bifunctional SulP family inorganic anion transporter/carbonic anhydrase [Sphingobacteriales bacterium]